MKASDLFVRALEAEEQSIFSAFLVRKTWIC